MRFQLTEIAPSTSGSEGNGLSIDFAMPLQTNCSTQGRIEDSDLEDTLGGQKQHGDPDHRSGQHLDEGGGVKTPQEKRHVEPAHAGGAQLVQGDQEVDAGEDGGETKHENPEPHPDH